MRLRDTMPAAMIAVACAVGTVVFATRARPEPVPRVRAPQANRQLLDILEIRSGERIAGWRVAAVGATPDGAVDVTMARDGIEFVLTIAPLGRRPENPPFSTASHAIYYGHAQPAGAQIPAGALRAITAELMRRLDR